MAKFDNDKVMSFKADDISVEFFGHNQMFWNLSGKSSLPSSVEKLRGGVQAHYLNRLGRCHGFGARKTLEKCTYAKPMISMAMGDIDGGQVSIQRRDPVCQSGGLLDRHVSIDEHGVPLPIDEGRSHRLKIGISHARRPVGHNDGYARCHKDLPVQTRSFR